MSKKRFLFLSCAVFLFALTSRCGENSSGPATQAGSKAGVTADRGPRQDTTATGEATPEGTPVPSDPVSIAPYAEFDNEQLLTRSLKGLALESAQLAGNVFHLLLPEIVGRDQDGSINLYWDWHVDWQAPETVEIQPTPTPEAATPEGTPTEVSGSENPVSSEPVLLDLPYRYRFANRSYGLYAEVHPDPVKGEYLDLMLVYTNRSKRTQSGVWASVRLGMNAFFRKAIAPDFGDRSDLNEDYVSDPHENPYLARVFMGLGGIQTFVNDLNYPVFNRSRSLRKAFPLGYLRGSIPSQALSGSRYRYHATMEQDEKRPWFESSEATDDIYIAAMSKSGDQVIGMAWENIYDLWFQSAHFALCLHVSPYFGVVEPGQSVTRRGRIFFVQSGGYEEFIRRLTDWKSLMGLPVPEPTVTEETTRLSFQDSEPLFRVHSCGLTPNSP